MKFYLELQIARSIRWLKKSGVHPLLGLMLGVLVFVVLSRMLFYKLEHASWVYLFIVLTLLFMLNDTRRNERLQAMFAYNKYLLLRSVENFLLSLPFLIYLLFESDFLLILAIVSMTMILPFFKTRLHWNTTIPTPFKKFPFEFIVGFRKTFWLIAVAYFLMIKGVQVDNYNLVMFGFGMLFIMSMFYYQKPEYQYFVWIYSCGATSFLKKKLTTAAVCVLLLSFPGLVGILISFPANLLSTVLIYLSGYIFIGSMIVAKYSAYPHEMNIPQGIFYALSLIFPPMLVITIGVFYSQSKKRLKPILKC